MRIALALLALAVLAPAAGAETIAEVDAPTPISAGSGWVVWSQHVDGHFRLSSWHEGETRRYPAEIARRPFDADVGTDSDGRPVATYSRCSPLTDLCSIRVLDLADGVVRGAGIPRQPLQSDRRPSMWRGRIAFARSDPEHPTIDRIELWSPATRTLRRLPHGAIPTRCPYNGRHACDAVPRAGTVLGMDLGRTLLAFAWQIDAPGAGFDRGYEIRADRLADGRSALVGAGDLGQTCGGDGAGIPSSPAVQGGAVVYAALDGSCSTYTSSLFRFTAFPVAGVVGRLEGVVLATAIDGAALYTLSAPPGAGNEDVTCARRGPCRIASTATPSASPVTRTPRSPFF